MNILKFHELTKDARPKEERMLELKEKMLLFLTQPALSSGIEILHLCISLTNDYLYCSKPITLKYRMPIEPDQYHIDRFNYDWNSWYYVQKLDETSYRFYCKEFFELTNRILFHQKYTEEEIEKEYLLKVNQPVQLTLF